MDRSFSRVLLTVVLTFCLVRFSPGQTKAVSSARLSPELQRVARKAALIFTGTVIAIAPVRASGSEDISTVEVTFQVEQAIRGLRPGQRYTIHEWAGLWRSAPRYRIGQKMMLFLYSPSRAGLTSPVEGALGRYDVDRFGQVSIPPPHPPGLAILPRPISAGNQHVPVRAFSRAIREVMEESR